MMLPELDSISSTFFASLRSVGTAVTMAAVGLYMHQTGAIGAEGKRTLAVLSQQVTFPLFLFTKIIYCNQDWSSKPCPDVTRSLADVWMLLWWPAYVVAVGLSIGWIVAKVCGTPKRQIRSVLAACGFGNSTGLPITLLNVIHANFPAESDLGRIDPTLFLSVFLLLYPILQWGIGGWLLAPSSDDEVDEEPLSDGEMTAMLSSTTTDDDDHAGGERKSDRVERLSSSRTLLLNHNVLNNTARKSFYQQHRHGMTSADEGLYMTEVNLQKLWQEEEEREHALHDQSFDTHEDHNNNSSLLQTPPRNVLAASSTVDYGSTATGATPQRNETMPLMMSSATPEASSRSLPPPTAVVSNHDFDTDSLWQTVRNILERCFQPPVIGAVAGILVAITPGARGIFVDLVDRNNSAPLQFFFDGLYAVGETAVPINMMILGCNLSSSSKQTTTSTAQTKGDDNSDMLPMKSMIGIVIGKMMLMPLIGILSGWVLKNFVLDIPADIDGAFYLVLMIVFLTPTANNVIIMVELSGSGAKEGMARVIALQYLVAPVILSLTMTIAIGVASGWSS